MFVRKNSTSGHWRFHYDDRISDEISNQHWMRLVHLLRQVAACYGNYESSLIWVITLSFQLQFEVFHLESENWKGECNFDFVSVFEGSKENSKNLIKTICGKVSSRNNKTQLKHNFISQSGELFVKFFSDNTVSQRFNRQYIMCWYRK